jgi:hypothetical protein
MVTRMAVVQYELLYGEAKAKVRYRPSWLLRRRERRIVAQQCPALGDLAELAALRRELRVRLMPAAGWWRRG